MSTPLRDGDVIRRDDELYCYDTDRWEPFAFIAASYIGCVFDRAQITAPTRRKTSITAELGTTPNNREPKLPLLLEVKQALFDHDDLSPDFKQYEVGVLDCYKYIERQLSATR